MHKPVLALAAVLAATAYAVGPPGRAPGPAPVLALAGASAPTVVTVSSPVVLDADHPLVGEGHGRTVYRAAPGYTGDLVVGSHPDAHNPGLRLQGVTLDCAGTAARGAFLFAADDLVVDDVEVTGCQARGPLVGALQGRGIGASDLVEDQRWTDVWVHDNAGTGLHNGLGTRGAFYSRITAERNGGDGLWVGGSEGQVLGVRSRGNGGAGVKLNNLMQTTVDDVQAHGNAYGLQVIELVDATANGLLLQNNRTADLYLDPTVLAEPNYGVTRHAVLSGVVGPNGMNVGGYRAAPGEQAVSGDSSRVDLEDVHVTAGG